MFDVPIKYSILKMTDIYDTREIDERLRFYMDTVLHMLKKVSELDTFKEIGDRNVLPSKILEAVRSEDDCIGKELYQLREYVHRYYDLIKDMYCSQYMSIFHFLTLEDRLRKNDDGTYEHFYIADSVKSVLLSPQWIKDSVSTLFVGDHYDIKLRLVANMISPDTLVLKYTRSLELGPIPFLQGVRKISLEENPMLGEHMVMTNDVDEYRVKLVRYLDVLTDLHLIHSHPVYYCPEIEKMSALESLFIDIPRSWYTGVNDSGFALLSILSTTLYNMRVNNRRTLKAFRLIDQNIREHIPSDDVLNELYKPLMKELANHPLEVLGIDVPTDYLFERFIKLIDHLPDLKTLIICSTSGGANTIMKRLKGKLLNLKSLVINKYPTADVSTNDHIISFVTKSISLCEVIINGSIERRHVNSMNRHTKKNISRNKLMLDYESLLTLLPPIPPIAPDEKVDETIVKLLYTNDEDEHNNFYVDSVDRDKIIEIMQTENTDPVDYS